MQQITKYTVENLGVDDLGILSKEDQGLVDTFTLYSIPFKPGKHTVDVDIHNLNDEYLETVRDIKSYSVKGTKNNGEVSELSLNPVQDSLDIGYHGDVILHYSFFENLFSTDNQTKPELYISDISLDRTELRVKCLDLDNNSIKSYVDSIQKNFISRSTYFSEIYLDFFIEDIKVVCTNIATEVVDDQQYIVLKLYNTLPDQLSVKSRFYILGRVGDSVKFKVIRSVEIVEDPVPHIKGPNFEVGSNNQDNTSVTDYLTYQDLFTYPASGSYNSLRDLSDKERCRVSVDHENFENFVHFSSAEERLENFRYKIDLIFQYEDKISELSSGSFNAQEIKNCRDKISGIISNFDHYDKFLYFENNPKAWPKESGIKPYINLRESDPRWKAWYGDPEEGTGIVSEAISFDENNENALINSIPFAIRENPDNEPYVIFIHMIGHHFDNEWVYAKAISDRYNGDNREDYGISRDLVRDALKSFGFNFYESNQNLGSVFERINPDNSLNVEISGSGIVPLHPDVPYVDPKGTGTYLFKKLSSDTIDQDSYLKEVYKRIYHNIPVLLKQKGTARGLRALINCFGIPDDILEIGIQGGFKVDSDKGYFGPQQYHSGKVTSGSGYVISSPALNKVRVEDSILQIPAGFSTESGELYSASTLNSEVSVFSKNYKYSDDEPGVRVGFNLNKQFNDYATASLSGSFDYDDIVGDLGNHRENYGTAFDEIRNKVIQKAKESQVYFKSPTSIISLVKYFDSVLFRAVENFLPSRTTVSTDVIVEDNLLHRNRYTGVEVKGNLPQYEGIIDTAFITGSDSALIPYSNLVSGSLKFDGRHFSGSALTPRAPYRDYNKPYYKHWTVSDKEGEKLIQDDPRYTGEYSGSTKVVITSEVFNNPYRKPGANDTVYLDSASFADIPSPLLCSVIVDAATVGTQHIVGSTIFSPNQPEQSYTVVDFNLNETKTFTDVSQSNPTTTYFSRWVKGEGTSSIELEDDTGRGPLFPSCSLIGDTDPTYLSAIYYTGYNHHRFRLQVEQQVSGSGYGPQYGEGHLIVSIPEDYGNVFGIGVILKLKYTDGKTYSVDITKAENLKEGPQPYRGGKWLGVLASSGSLYSYGIERLGDETSRLTCPRPLVSDFWDADWFETYIAGSGWENDNKQCWHSEWKEDHYEIISGSKYYDSNTAVSKDMYRHIL